MSDQEERIRQAVRQRYGDLAQKSSACCGAADGGAEQCAGALYDHRLLEDLPGEVKELSLGCGDPITIASLRPGEWVLDLGSGAGLDCFLAARQVGEEGRVVGVDMTAEMVALANSNKERLGVDNVEFRLGRIEALPVKDASFDVVISNCVINLSPDKAAVFREAFRALRPGGRICVSDVVVEGEFSAALRSDLDRWAECVAGAIELERYLDLMRQAGFVELKVSDKVSAEEIIPRREGMPRLFSARVTGRKPPR